MTHTTTGVSMKCAQKSENENGTQYLLNVYTFEYVKCNVNILLFPKIKDSINRTESEEERNT